MAVADSSSRMITFKQMEAHRDVTDETGKRVRKRVGIERWQVYVDDKLTAYYDEDCDRISMMREISESQKNELKQAIAEKFNANTDDMILSSTPAIVADLDEDEPPQQRIILP